MLRLLCRGLSYFSETKTHCIPWFMTTRPHGILCHGQGIAIRCHSGCSSPIGVFYTQSRPLWDWPFNTIHTSSIPCFKNLWTMSHVKRTFGHQLSPLSPSTSFNCHGTSHASHVQTWPGCAWLPAVTWTADGKDGIATTAMAIPCAMCLHIVWGLTLTWYKHHI